MVVWHTFTVFVYDVYDVLWWLVYMFTVSTMLCVMSMSVPMGFVNNFGLILISLCFKFI